MKTAGAVLASSELLELKSSPTVDRLQNNIPTSFAIVARIVDLRSTA